VVKIFVIPARDEPVAVILRRGPTDWYHVIKWNTRRDVFEHGAWMRGRIYEEKCDISPDGRLFIYFVRKDKHPDKRFTHAWTAISRVPWLQALVVWPQGTTYYGGGRFVDNRKIVSRGFFKEPLEDFPLRGIELVDGDRSIHRSSSKVFGAGWCGRDHRGHDIYTRGGKLFRRIKKDDKLIADFTDLEPDPQPAPDWAGRRL
jgi:hypothetical protein